MWCVEFDGVWGVATLSVVCSAMADFRRSYIHSFTRAARFISYCAVYLVIFVIS